MRAQYPSRGFEDEPRRQQQVSRQMELEMTTTVCQVAAAAAASRGCHGYKAAVRVTCLSLTGSTAAPCDRQTDRQTPQHTRRGFMHGSSAIRRQIRCRPCSRAVDNQLVNYRRLMTGRAGLASITSRVRVLAGCRSTHPGTSDERTCTN